MAISLGIILGIVAMITWGTADFLVAKAVRRANVIKTFIWTQIVGVIFFLLIFFLFFKFPTVSVATLALILITGLILFIAGLAFFKGLQVGYLSVISPIASSGAIIAVILSLVFLKETITTLQATGIALAILGTILTSFRFHDIMKLKLKSIEKGVKYALITAIGWGVMLVLIDILVDKIGWFFPIFFIKAAAVFYVLTYSGFMKINISFPKNVTLLIILVGIMEAAAFLAFSVGLSTVNTSIIAPIVTAFPVVTIILARIFFKEILELTQKIGVVSVLIGLVLLAL